MEDWQAKVAVRRMEMKGVSASSTTSIRDGKVFFDCSAAQPNDMTVVASVLRSILRPTARITVVQENQAQRRKERFCLAISSKRSLPLEHSISPSSPQHQLKDPFRQRGSGKLENRKYPELYRNESSFVCTAIRLKATKAFRFQSTPPTHVKAMAWYLRTSTSTRAVRLFAVAVLVLSFFNRYC
jgi:hypothetical protein